MRVWQHALAAEVSPERGIGREKERHEGSDAHSAAYVHGPAVLARRRCADVDLGALVKLLIGQEGAGRNNCLEVVQVRHVVDALRSNLDCGQGFLAGRGARGGGTGGTGHARGSACAASRRLRELGGGADVAKRDIEAMNAVVGHVMFLLRTVLWESALYRRYATQRELCATVAVKHTRPPMLLGLDRDAKTGATLRASTKHRRKLERASGRIRGAKQSAECDRLNCRAFSEGFLRLSPYFPRCAAVSR
ncbi:hypothetical protein TI83_06895 [Rathayibacter toxicus]|nr:hypothetical protein [Rathayibacter toxicus]AJM77745.1 hypothetical protein TI83_06895 [Rathayibacter toxicus]